MASFGHYIKTEREKREWTQTDFGAKVGINSSAISRIENDTQKFSKTKLPKLAEVVGVSLQEIKDLFYADKFASEAYKNKCSDKVFIVAENTVQYLRTINSKQAKINF